MMCTLRKSMWMALVLVLIASMACVAAERMGGWFDEIVLVEETDMNKGLARMQAGEFDLYALGMSKGDLFKTIKSSPNLAYDISYGSYNEITFNPIGPEFPATGKLNPFSVPKIREAMNMLIDRQYICDEILGGLGVPRYFAMNTAFPDYARFADVARVLEIKYAHNPTKANEIISAEMRKLGATLVSGKWHYKGEPVKIIALIRTEDERKNVGDYVSNLLEGIGFTVDRQYKNGTEASPIWINGDPTLGKWHLYTSGWVTTGVARDVSDNFEFFHTKRGYSSSPLWQAYTPVKEFDDISFRLSQRDFKSLDERADLFKQALELSMEDSVRIWLFDRVSIWPHPKNIKVATDLGGGINAAYTWALTVQRTNKEGGRLTIGSPNVLVDPWNPLGGSNMVYDMMPQRGSGEAGILPDPFTGLSWPQRVEKAEVIMKEGLPVGKTLDWLDLKFVKENKVPADAWADWDAKAQRWVTVAEKYPDGVTASRKVILHYNKDLFKTTKWHDGSTFSLADIVMGMIVNFDRTKPESAVYDEGWAGQFESTLSQFRGWKIVSENPLIVEYYSDLWYLDAEDAASGADVWPVWAYGYAAWHNLDLGLRAEKAGELAFSRAKSDKLNAEWLSLIAGPSMGILSKHLDQAISDKVLPYAPTMSKYITAQEAATRMANLKKFYQEKKHFCINTGPYYIDSVHPVEKIVVMKHFADFPDAFSKWAKFGVPMVAEVDVVGENRVRRSVGTTFTVNITFENKPYAMKDIDFVKYMVFDSKDNLVIIGEAKAVKNGQWSVALTPQQAAMIPVGTARIEVAVAAIPVSIPSFDSLEFVVLP